MDRKEKLLIYPYDIETVPIVKYCELLCGYEICGLVSPQGWGFTGRDAGYADGGRTLGIIVSSDFDGELEKCDTVFFVESHIKLDFERIIKPKLLKAAAAGKNIICTLVVDSEAQEEIARQSGSCGAYYKYMNNSGKDSRSIPEIEELYELNTPVIFVLGLSERTQKFEIQLALRKHVMDMGYKISQVGSRSYCELFGFHSLPQFMHDRSFSESQKIVLFNRFVKSIEIREKPDVIVIGIPGGIMPFNNRFTNGFGMLAYEISQAVVPDAAVFSILYENYEKENLLSMFTLIKHRLGFEVDSFNLSNTKFDWDASKQDDEISYVTVDSQFLHNVKEKLGSTTFQIYSVMDTTDALEMTRSIIDKLEEYAEVQSV